MSEHTDLQTEIRDISTKTDVLSISCEMDPAAPDEIRLSRFGALAGIVSVALAWLGCVGFYYLCKGLLWVGLWVSR